ncbi:uncharacterized protein LOC129595929 [Paramacrobiotus metropolitanus]|uniref:Bifunctional trehalose-6-phosphate synthase/trehalose phosphatase n=1 Tax=Paramacrobiotus metropolitanus TaxID=2943436 RepID=A0A8E4DJ51_9BILA|nr:uncharacterized protein LOC129595929 [Paramacrobiotus metropolitanus]BCY04412.1 bifunctional trehalose-6-phosphate synthase/trehalose phosphatase [Paramacrobiotus metropolitanus]
MPLERSAKAVGSLLNQSLIIVSNRLPVSVKKGDDGRMEVFPSVGGLATGLSSYTKNADNKWIGWPGIPSNDLTEDEKRFISEELRQHNCYPVFLTQDQLNDFYNGYSNSILWPLFHDLPVTEAAIRERDRFWNAYQQVNRLFLEVILALSGPEDAVWIHDYQLMTLPDMLRQARQLVNIGFFLHIPFPAAQNFADHLKWGADLVAGLLGADLVGFHVHSYMDNFMAAVESYGMGTIDKDNARITLPDRIVQVAEFPIGIDYKRYMRASKDPAVLQELARLKEMFPTQKVILTVDRLDPSKGLVERAAAYQTLLQEYPNFHGKVTLMMLVVPSRTEIEAYKNLKSRLEELVEDINKTFGNESWTPVVYMYKSLPFERLNALYQLADVAFIAPWRDGMNLVAKEYLASKPNKDGVLVLSKTAGAAEELTDAVIVDPARPETLVSGLVRALKMPAEEFRRRAGSMQQQIQNADIHNWANSFINALHSTADNQEGGAHTLGLTGRQAAKLNRRFGAASSQLVLLDYDCVIAPLTPAGMEGLPAELHEILKELSVQADIVIVSGQTQSLLEEKLGGFDNITLVAEHGLFERLPGEKSWKSYRGTDWQAKVLEHLEKFTEKVQGAELEKKDCSLVWHYDKASSYDAQNAVLELKRVIGPLAGVWKLDVLQGSMFLEVRPKGRSKGSTAKEMAARNQYDFVLVVGDDSDDCSLFVDGDWPEEAVTVKVGPGRTGARLRVFRPEEVLGLLRSFKASGSVLAVSA